MRLIKRGMSDYANHIDYRLNEITGGRRSLIEISKLLRNSLCPNAPNDAETDRLLE